jgi:hypothetical protein
MTTYIYEPLDYGKAQIRFLKLWPAPDYSDPIRISLLNATLPPSRLATSLESALEAIDLDSKDPKIDTNEFIALSYVWGSPVDPQQVFVKSAPEGAHTISITRNLDVALRNIRLDSGYLLMWIDAICIDQGNPEERSHQISLMDSIYTNGKVIVWLGPEEDDSDRALNIISYLGRRVLWNDDGDIERHPHSPPREPDEPIWESLDEVLPYDEEGLGAIISLFERPWFTRLWIRQEIALADTAILQSGRGVLDWILFQNAATCLCRKRLNLSRPFDLNQRLAQVTPTIINICDVNLFSYQYETLRDENRGVRFTDPRDMIYGVGSLLSREDKKLGVRPDYSLEAADVFMDVCVRIVERQSRTYFLNTCELSSISVPNLPSWAPDWSGPMTAQRLLTSPWSSCGFISANATYLGNRVLRVSGIQIDKIESIRNLYDDVHDEPVKDLQVVIDYIWRCYPEYGSIDSPYDEKQSILDAYCRTFACDRFCEGFSPPNDQRPTFDEAKEALKKIWSMDEDWTGFDDLRNDPSIRRFISTCGYCVGRCFLTTKQGYVGLAPLGSQPGDIISVILGCDFPVILRQELSSGTKPSETRWKVVGVCYVNGLMSGEAIYGSLPSHYRAVRCTEAADDKDICGNACALLDSRTNDLKTDPAAVLKEFGIKPDVWSREPHRLEVSEAVLREAGVELRDFFLV